MYNPDMEGKKKTLKTPVKLPSPLFVQLMHTNYYKIVKQLNSFKIITVAATCFGTELSACASLKLQC